MPKQPKRKTRKEKIDESQETGKKGKTKSLPPKSLPPKSLPPKVKVYAGDDDEDTVAILGDEQAVSGFNGSPCQKCGVNLGGFSGFCWPCVEALNKEKDAELEVLKAEVDELREQERVDCLELSDKHQVIQDLRDEVDELQRQAKARPFPQASSGKRNEPNLVGLPVLYRGRPGMFLGVDEDQMATVLFPCASGAKAEVHPIQQCQFVAAEGPTLEALKRIPEGVMLAYGHTG